MNAQAACTVVAFLAAGFLSASISPQLAEWGQGPAKFLMTKDEARQWTTIQSDSEARAFIDLFWARRDPTPETPRNEFRESFEARVAFADANFADGLEHGALTDRGKAFILLGPPERVSGRAGQPATASNGRVYSEGNLQYWMYAHQHKPRFVPQADFTLAFSEEMAGVWKIATTERVNPDLLFQLAANASIVSPDLTKPREFKAPGILRRTTFNNAELETAFEQIRMSSHPVGSATVTLGAFVTSNGERFISAQLYAPAASGLGAGKKAAFFAVVQDSSGNVYDIEETDATAGPSGNGAYVDTSFRLEPGVYTVTLGVVASGKVLAASSAPITVEALDPAAVGISPLFLATAVYPLKTDWNSTDPFTFGGIKVVPKGDSVFPTAGDLWYFVELRNPGLTDNNKPNIRVGVDITGKTAKGPVALRLPMTDASLAKFVGEANYYGVGQALPLEGFIPGDYILKVHIHDGVLGKDYELQKAFTVRND